MLDPLHWSVWLPLCNSLILNVSSACILAVTCLVFLQFVGVSQPVNALAFVFDGLHYGISDFQYAAFSMVGN